MPATRASVAEDIIKLKNAGLVTVIIDLEDAIGDDQVDNAEESIIQHLIYLVATQKMSWIHRTASRFFLYEYVTRTNSGKWFSAWDPW